MLHPRLELLSRKPTRWFVVCGNLGGYLTNQPIGPRKNRWSFTENGTTDTHYFPSRRAALCWISTGEKFTTKPVYASRGGQKSTQRIR